MKRTSRFKGVSRHRRTGRFDAYVWLGRDAGRQEFLGGFKEEAAAARARDLSVVRRALLAAGAQRSRTVPAELRHTLEKQLNYPLASYEPLPTQQAQTDSDWRRFLHGGAPLPKPCCGRRSARLRVAKFFQKEEEELELWEPTNMRPAEAFLVSI